MKRANLLLIVIFTLILGVLLSYLIKTNRQSSPIDILHTPPLIKEKPLEKYSIDNLSKTGIGSGKFEIHNTMFEEDKFSSYLFSFEFEPALDGNKKTTTGQVNLPIGIRKYPLVLMLRGYVDQELYKTGDGTRNAARFFAENGFITIAPDFLGYANSSEEAENIFESRFQTYTTILSLLETLESLQSHPTLVSGPTQLTNQLINQSPIFIWAHSNGGQIALTVLEITGNNIPTTLWAPVTENFPYSILYYTNEAGDRGKLIRSELSKF
ncbi:hypothetical protein KKB40_05220, partial [Patescibacteria group bacterium]|nr:hypothetical protein [Patescibacteria group bacterium]